jgi:hypothetical protein
MQTRVTFRFPHDSIVRYVERRPRRGERVSGLRGEIFVISSTERDGAGGHIVTCVTPIQYAEEARNIAHGARALALEMKERTVEIKRKTLELRRRIG